eukprot:5164639-Lingulodinium_polyedra.AAC.1
MSSTKADYRERRRHLRNRRNKRNSYTIGLMCRTCLGVLSVTGPKPVVTTRTQHYDRKPAIQVDYCFMAGNAKPTDTMDAQGQAIDIIKISDKGADYL